MLGNRRNVVFRVSIVINIAVLLYAAMQLSSSGAPGEEWAPVVSAAATEMRYLDLRNETPALPPRSEPSALAGVAAAAGPSAAALSQRPDETTSQKIPSTMPTTNKTTSSTMSVLELENRIVSRSAIVISSESDMTNDTLDQADEDALSDGTLSRLRVLLGCNERDFLPRTVQRGDFLVLQNFVRADHGPLLCHETVTYTTHAGYEFLDNIKPLVERWMAPVSLAIHAPGSDFMPTVNSIRYLRDCTGNDLIRQLVTFHLFFSYKHVPSQIPKPSTFVETPYNCTGSAPFMGIKPSSTYKSSKNLLYPVNVARNIARDAALTHFILPSDIELYPSPYLVPRFLNMIARNAPPLNSSTKPRVFPISIFEVDSSATVPTTKTELKAMLAKKKAIPFHKYVCPNCHNIPQGDQWMNANETDQMDVFHVGKRRGKFVHWEPIFIGTHQDPYYDERLSWEGKKDKMTQGYILCVKDYDFMILNNAFLCHKPGIKHYTKNPKRDAIAGRQGSFVKNVIMPELKKLYGVRNGCAL